MDLPAFPSVTAHSLLGEGSFASVFQATLVSSNEPVALKEIHSKSPQQEASILSKLNHPHIVKLLSSFKATDYEYLVLELCDSDLFDVILGGLDNELTRKLFTQLCEAVAYCHKSSVYHRDLKPENVLLKDGMIKLADFGLATTDPLSDEFQIGSNRYMSPEVFCQKQQLNGCLKLPYISSANDVWALGIILINMLTGQNPWKEPSTQNQLFRTYLAQRETYFQNQFGFSSELSQVLQQVFEIDPFKRPSALKLIELLKDIPFFENQEVVSAEDKEAEYQYIDNDVYDVDTKADKGLNATSDETAMPRSQLPLLINSQEKLLSHKGFRTASQHDNIDMQKSFSESALTECSDDYHVFGDLGAALHCQSSCLKEEPVVVSSKQDPLTTFWSPSPIPQLRLEFPSSHPSTNTDKSHGPWSFKNLFVNGASKLLSLAIININPRANSGNIHRMN